MTYSLSVAFFSTLHTELSPPYTHTHTTVMRKSPTKSHCYTVPSHVRRGTSALIYRTIYPTAVDIF